MQDYKNNKILELIKEIVKVPNQTDYEINGVDTSRALFFYRREKEKFKIIPRGSYSVVDVATNKYLRISDSVLLGEAIEFQVCYLFVKTSSSYVDPFPELERLQEHYNELYSDFNNLLQQLESNNIVGDTMKMAYVLPQLDEGQVWVLRQGEMKAENIFDLDERLKEAYENFTRVFDNWIQTEKKPEFTQFVNGEKNRVLQEMETKKTQSIEEIDSHTTGKIQEIISEGILQKNQVTQEGNKQLELIKGEGSKQVSLVTAEGNKQVQRVTETGNNEVANVENEGETQYNRVKTEGDAQYAKIIATGIDNKVNKSGDTVTGNLIFPINSASTPLIIDDNIETSWARGIFYRKNSVLNSSIGKVRCPDSDYEAFYMGFGQDAWGGSDAIKYVKGDNLYVKNRPVYHSGNPQKNIPVADNRDHIPTPEDFAEQNITATFNINGVPVGDWHSLITVKGWESDYRTWQLAGASNINSKPSTGLWYRDSATRTTWNVWKKIAFETPVVTKLLWQGSVSAVGTVITLNEQDTNFDLIIACGGWTGLTGRSTQTFNAEILSRMDVSVICGNRKHILRRNSANQYVVIQAHDGDSSADKLTHIWGVAF